MSETDSLRSDIEMTRRRMDDTVDALGERLHGRHLVDEVIGFFRSSGDTGNETAARMREKLSETAGNAANAVVDTVKKNPLPILLITAGAAWLAYSATRSRKDSSEDDADDRYDPDTHYDRPLEYPGGTASDSMGAEAGDMAEEGASRFQSMKDTVKDKASAAADQVKEKFSDLSDATRDKFQSVKDRASEFGSRVRDRAGEIGSQVSDKTKELYGQTRDKVVQTTDEHPLEVGLGCLAVGVLIGLALPTPDPVNRFAGPTVDRLKQRTRDASKEMVQKGKRVVRAATDAAKHEAESQGLTMDRLREGGQKVAESAANAAGNTAQQERLPLQDVSPAPGSSQQNQSPTADPSGARPGM